MQKSLNAFKAKTKECVTAYKTGDYEQTISICNDVINVIKEFDNVELDNVHSRLLSIVLETRAKCYKSLNRPDKFLEDYAILGKINPNHNEVGEFFANADRQLTKGYHNAWLLVINKGQEILNLPNKTTINITDTENIKYDKIRLDFIKASLRFLGNELKTEQDLVNNNPELTIFDKYYLNLLLLEHGKQCFQGIGDCIFNLSGQLRGEYEGLLNNYSINWVTLEHIARVIDDVPAKITGIAIFPRNEYESQILSLFYREFQNVQLIADEALKDIFKDDIEKLITIFDYISKGSKGAPFPNLGKALAIKALSKLILDTSSLANILGLTCGIEPTDDYNLEENPKHFNRITRSDADNALSYKIKPNVTIDNMLRNIDKKLYQHAILRKWQKIGEFITNKNLSSLIKELNSTIDWQVFIDIRNAITHQEEKSYKYNVNSLLSSNLDILVGAIQDINYEFVLRLQDLILTRYKKLPVKLEDNLENIGNFWQAFYQQELASNNPSVVIKSRVSKEEYEKFMSAFAEINAPEDIKLKWEDFLLGNSNNPSKKAWKEMLKPIANYKDLKKIAKKLYNPSTLLKDKQVIEEKKLADERLKQAEEQKDNIDYTGLEYTKQLRDLLVENIKEKQIDNLGMLQSAIDALKNIKEFLEQDDFIKMDFNYPNINVWSNVYKEEKQIIFYTRMLTALELRDAIEYNAGQLLQNLYKLKARDEVISQLLSDEFYEPLRLLRNYIEHGNHIIDAQRYRFDKEPDILNKKYKIVGPIMMKLIFDLLPQLETVSGNHSSITEFASYDNLAPQLDIEAKIEHVDLVGSPSTKGFDDGEEYC